MKSCVQLQSCVQLHVSNYIFCHKAIVVTTGTAHCFMIYTCTFSLIFSISFSIGRAFIFFNQLHSFNMSIFKDCLI